MTFGVTFNCCRRKVEVPEQTDPLVGELNGFVKRYTTCVIQFAENFAILNKRDSQLSPYLRMHVLFETLRLVKTIMTSVPEAANPTSLTELK